MRASQGSYKSPTLVSCPISNVAFVAIKMGRRQDGCQARAGPGAGRDRVPVRQLPDRS